jgi:hypothetical protein
MSQEFLKVLESFRFAKGEEQQVLVETYPELLLSEIVGLFFKDQSTQAQKKGDPDLVKFYDDLGALLHRCRTIGIAAAFEERKGKADPRELQLIIRQVDQLTHVSDMPRRVQLCEQALALVKRADDPSLWASLQTALGISLTQSPQGGAGREPGGSHCCLPAGFGSKNP